MSGMQIGAIVELLPGCEGMYDVAKSGWRAVIKDTKTDEDGFELIYVGWDKDNWRWQPGQVDGWTYPAHFKVVGQTTIHDVIATAQQRVAQEAADEQGCPHCGEDHAGATGIPNRAQYEDALTEAASSAMEGEGFVILWVAKEPVSENAYALQSNLVAYGMDDAASDALEIQMLMLASGTLSNVIEEKVAHYEP